MELSVVIITRNQFWNVTRLIESVLAECSRLENNWEVALVDSASTDGTIEAVETYPITVMTLCPNQPLTAAAARHVGFEGTTGRYVLFVDGDMELIPGWLQAAMTILDGHPDIATVTGRRVDMIPSPPSSLRAEFAHGPEGGEAAFRDVRHGGGAALYRRRCLDRVGSFNPYLFSDEEPELCIRLRHAGGYRVVMLDTPHVIHYTEPLEKLSTLVERARRNLYLGSGQAIRQLWGSPMLKHYIRERGFGLLPGLVLASGLGLLLHSALTRDVTLFMWWGITGVAVLALDAVRKGSIRDALLSLLARTLHVIGTVRGLMLKPGEPIKYPLYRVKQ